MYVHRYLEDEILSAHKHFKVLYLGGPRQVGKTTLLLRLAQKNDVSFVSLDEGTNRELAQNDPALFLDRFPPPVFIDEAQYASGLFPYIKLRVDQAQKAGMYWLSGSQHFPMIKGLQETLAGRVAVLSLLGLSGAEERGVAKTAKPFLPEQQLSDSSGVEMDVSTPKDVFTRIFRGCFPALATDPGISRRQFYEGYIQTYVDRDVREIFDIEKVGEFRTALRLAAAHTGQVLNVSSLARDAGVSVHALRGWLSILQASGIIYLLQPYSRNVSKRFIRAPKVYFLDTGLATYLTRWQTVETLQSGAAAGPMFETYVVGEIIKSYLFRGIDPPLYYMRDRVGHEIDLLIEHNGILSPIEIKMAAKIDDNDLGGIRYFRKNNPIIGPGGVICLSSRIMPYDRTDTVFPAICIS